MENWQLPPSELPPSKATVDVVEAGIDAPSDPWDEHCAANPGTLPQPLPPSVAALEAATPGTPPGADDMRWKGTPSPDGEKEEAM